MESLKQLQKKHSRIGFSLKTIRAFVYTKRVKLSAA